MKVGCLLGPQLHAPLSPLPLRAEHLGQVTESCLYTCSKGLNPHCFAEWALVLAGEERTVVSIPVLCEDAQLPYPHGFTAAEVLMEESHLKSYLNAWVPLGLE